MTPAPERPPALDMLERYTGVTKGLFAARLVLFQRRALLATVLAYLGGAVQGVSVAAALTIELSAALVVGGLGVAFGLVVVVCVAYLLSDVPRYAADD